MWRLHPGRMMGTSERQLLRARFAWLCKWLLSHVHGGGRFIVKVVCLPAPLLDGLPVESVSGDLAQPRELVHDTALSLLLVITGVTLSSGSALRGNSSNWACPVHVTVQLGPLSLGMQIPPGAVMVDATEHAWQ